MATRVTPQSSHENVIAKTLARADAYRRFNVEREAIRIAKKRAARAEYRRKVV